MLGDVNKRFVFKSLLTTPSNVLPLHLKQTFPPIIWIFTETEGDWIKSRLPFKIYSTLLVTNWNHWWGICFSDYNSGHNVWRFFCGSYFRLEFRLGKIYTVYAIYVSIFLVQKQTVRHQNSSIFPTEILVWKADCFS